MRILYVTSYWSGLEDIAVLGLQEPRGMVSFVSGLRGLVEAGHTVDLVVTCLDPPALDIGPEWLEGCDIEFVKWRTKGALAQVGSLRRAAAAIRRKLKAHSYDFVYAQGASGSVGNLLANLHGIPCGGRLYGSWLSLECFPILELPKHRQPLAVAKLAARRPLETALLRLKKKFLIATNDGSRSDVVQQVLGRDNYEFHHVLNGRNDAAPAFEGEPLPEELTQPGEASESPFILYPARIMPYKGPDKAALLLRELHRIDPDRRVDLVLAGHLEDQDLVAQIRSDIAEAGLEERVHWLGPIPPARLRALRVHPRCLAVGSFYKMSNLGNVALESLSDGCVLLSVVDTSVESIATHRESCLLVEDMAQGAQELKRLLDEPELADTLRKGALAAADEHIKPWSERVRWEVEMVERAADAA